jgi:hypothetical protein
MPNWTIIIWYTLLSCAIQAGAAEPGDTAITPSHRFELSGLLSFESYGSNLHTVNKIEFGVNWLRFMSSSVEMEAEFRNNSMQGGALATCFRLIRGRHELRPGACGGIRSLWVGGYSDKTPFVGFKGIYSFDVISALSLRLEVKARWYFEERMVFGTKAMAGMCWSFGRVGKNL